MVKDNSMLDVFLLGHGLDIQNLFCDLRNYYIDEFQDSDHENDMAGRMVLINRNCVLLGELLRLLCDKRYMLACLSTRSLYENLVSLTFILHDSDKMDIRSRRYYMSQYQTDVKLYRSHYYGLLRGSGMLNSELRLTDAGARYINLFRKEFNRLFQDTPNFKDAKNKFEKKKQEGKTIKFKFSCSYVNPGDVLDKCSLDDVNWYSEDKSWDSLNSLVNRALGEDSLAC